MEDNPVNDNSLIEVMCEYQNKITDSWYRIQCVIAKTTKVKLPRKVKKKYKTKLRHGRQ